MNNSISYIDEFVFGLMHNIDIFAVYYFLVHNMLRGQHDIQRRIWNLRAQGKTYRAIITQVPEVDYKYQVATCLFRTAMGYAWYPGFPGGNTPFLCPEDEHTLVELLKDNCALHNCVRTFAVLEGAMSLRKARQDIAVTQLLSLKCPELASKVDVDVEEPCRSWLNEFCSRNELRICSVTELQKLRHRAAHFENLKDFLNHISHRVLNIPAELVFNSDETMLAAKRRYKGVTLPGLQAIAPLEESTLHISSMVTISATGAQIPQLIVLPGLMNLPESLRRFTSRCWFASSSNGWMTRDLFLLWAINFSHWLTTYRLQLPATIRDSPALLYLDGHVSRQNYAAMDYLRRHNVIVIILPSHVTHILQPFDVGIAGPYKSSFKKSVLRKLSEGHEGGSRADFMRVASVLAAVEAYDKTVTFVNCQAAFRKSCLLPLFHERLRDSSFVLEGRGEEAVRGYQIGGKILTDEPELVNLRHVLQERRPAGDWCADSVRPVDVQYRLRNAPLAAGRQFSAMQTQLVRAREGYLAELVFP